MNRKTIDGRDTQRRSPGRRTRARRLALATAAFGLIALAGSAAAIASTGVSNPIEGAPTLRIAGDVVTLSLVGDTLLGDGAQEAIDLHGATWTGAHLDAFEPDDVVIANLEGPITDRTQPADPTQRWSYNAAPTTAHALAELGVDAVSLANNHAMDRGAAGLSDTAANATAAGIAAVGAGTTSDEARLPLLIESDDGVVAVSAFGDSSGSVTAAVDRPGLRKASAKNFAADYDAAKAAGADLTVAYIHWGDNYAEVSDRQRVLAQSLVDVGYDLVVGHGPHIVQPMELIDGVPVFYSLGNWIFGTPGRFKPDAPGYGLVLRVLLEPAQEQTRPSMSFEMSCLENDNAVVAYQPRACSPEDAASVLSSVTTDVRVGSDGVGRFAG